MAAPFAPATPGPRIVGLCEGYGGLTLGVKAVLGGTLVAYAEIKPAAVALLADRFPGVPNLGNLCTADWSGISADIVTVGWPCQPHSAAGLRLGEEDPRAIWPAVLDVIGTTRPLLVVGENVARIVTNGELRRAVRSLAAIGYVGAWRCLPAGDATIGAPHKRDRLCLVAVDASRPDAADAIAIAGWAAATDAARHGRREGRPGTAGQFGGPDAALGGGVADEPAALADAAGRGGEPGCPTCGHPESHHDDGGFCAGCGNDPECPDPELGRPPGQYPRLLPTPGADPSRNRIRSPEVAQARLDSGRRNLEDAVGTHLTPELLPTPTARDHKGAGWGDQPGRPLSETVVARLLPTPEEKLAHSGPDYARAARPESGGDDFTTAITRLAMLPTPTARLGDGHGTPSPDTAAARWGAYAPAIARWEAVLGREAPPPTKPSTKAPHNPQLSPEFVEWMMGLPLGWVTAGAVDPDTGEKTLGRNKAGKWTAPGERNSFLSLLGDGVVPQWAAVQITHLLPLALAEAGTAAHGADLFDALVAGLTHATSRRELYAIASGARAGWAPEHNAIAALRLAAPALPQGPGYAVAEGTGAA